MATDGPGFLAELRRRNVLRAVVLYAGAVWALAQGIAQLTPALGLPDASTRWFLIVCAIGFPFWVAFEWFYEFTPQGFRRDAEMAADAPIRHSNARKLDLAIIGVMAVAIVLLASGYFIRRPAPAAVATGIPAKSIAVLPFENLSADKGNAYFADGMQDLILTKLADIGDLKVISRTSTMKYASHPDDLKTVGQQLGVAMILEGSVQKQGNQVLVNVQLIDAKTDTHLWAESYTRTLDNVFGVEGEVAGKIATSLDAKVSPAESMQLAAVPTTNKAAYDAFLRAVDLVNKGVFNGDTASLEAAISLYRQAVQEDPGFALAFARLSYAESYLAWGSNGDVPQLRRQAQADAERALALQPGLAAAHVALGYSAYYGRRDYAAALQAFATALKLKPGDTDALAAQGYVQRRMGRWDAAIASLQQAVASDPRNVNPVFYLGDAYMRMGRYSEAEGAWQRVLALDPANTSARAGYADAIAFATGNIPRALAEVQGDDPELKFERVQLLTYQRKFRDALALLDSIPDTSDQFSADQGGKAVQQAVLYALVGDAERSRQLYQQALPAMRAQLKQLSGEALLMQWRYLAPTEAGAGHVAAAMDAVAKTLQLLADHPNEYLGPAVMMTCASAYATLHRPDLALPLLTKMAASPFGVTPTVLLWIDPVWDPIRKDPGFEALLKQYAKRRPTMLPAAPAS